MAASTVGRGTQVLVASADVGLRGQVSLALDGGRFEVVSATDTDEAVRRVAADPPQVLVLDLALEGRGAPALARTLRAQPATAGTRVVLLVDPSQDPATELPGVDATLTTPFTSLALLRKVDAVLSA